jgi:cell division transport system permease protein
VESVNYGKKTAKRILRVARVFEILSVLAILILLGAATILIGNTIRLSIFARRREIEVMKLVGASNWFVRGPFMVEGLLTGVIGAAAAVVLLFLGKELVLPATVGKLDAGKDVNAIAFEYIALMLLGLGLLLGAAGSTLTMRRFLRV